jgi:hypothetical protein
MTARITLVLTILMMASVAPDAQVSARASRYTLLDVVVFGAWLEVDRSTYPAAVQALLTQHIARWKAYQPRPRPEKLDPVREMVLEARENYERRLVAVTAGSGADRLARQYVDALRPCYEWEGFHDCPEWEAKFAEDYLGKNLNSPFRELLPLLAANRWLCAAEGYELEGVETEAARARRTAAAPLAVALKSRSLLIRTAAQEQKARGRCHP